MKRLTIAVAALLVAALLSSGCVVARAAAIRNMRVLPTEKPAEGKRRCVAWANTGHCQIWMIFAPAVHPEEENDAKP